MAGFRKHVIDVSCANHVACVLLQGGLVYTMGRNNEGQRGLGNAKAAFNYIEHFNKNKYFRILQQRP